MNIALNIIATTVLAVRGLIIPVQFEDLEFSNGTKSIESIAHQAEEYFNRENLEIGDIHFDISPIYNEPKKHSVYGANNSSAKDATFYSLVQNACRKIDRDTDFSKYEFFLFAVPGKSEPDSGMEDLFWPQVSSLVQSNSILILDGKKLDKYAVFCELGPDGEPSGIGDFAHEMGHLLGLQDFYDTDGEKSGGRSEGLGGNLVLMDTGNKSGLGRTPPSLCAAELDILAPRRSEVLKKGHHMLADIGKGGSFFKMYSSSQNDYYLIENREGLCVTYIDKSETPAGYSDYQKRLLTAKERWELNEINCRPDRMCASCVARDIRDHKDCVKLDSLAIVDIQMENDGSVSFNVIEPISMISIMPLQDCAFIEWKSGIEDAMIKEVKVVWWADGEKLHYCDAINGEDGVFSVVLKDLKSSTRYFASLWITTIDEEEFRLTRPFTTRSVRDDSPAFIYLPSGLRTPDGNFLKGAGLPLIVYNANGEEKITWTFNGIEVGKDGILKLNENGTLKATIDYSDGSREIISKTINVK